MMRAAMAPPSSITAIKVLKYFRRTIHSPMALRWSIKFSNSKSGAIGMEVRAVLKIRYDTVNFALIFREIHISLKNGDRDSAP